LLSSCGRALLALHRYAEGRDVVHDLLADLALSTFACEPPTSPVFRSTPPQYELLHMVQLAEAKAAGDTPPLRPCACCKTPTPPEELKRCARCQWTHYCSAGCQRDDWRRHKKTCCPLEMVD